jgi:hypothetical protein
MANVVIDIAAEFTGNKAFKQADNATTTLTKNVKKLAGAVGLAYSTQAIVSFGKAAVKAFSEDEAAALRLNRAVENLGIGFANPAIAEYISNLEKSAAVADDILRPAFQGLLTTTGSLTKSQELLNNAITISRASGVDLATVTDDLGKGYVGITRGLSKYNTGLTRAELTSKSFNEILGTILKRSAGAAEDYLDTTAYKFDVLSVATSNASEIIGGGLVDAFALVGGGTDAKDAAYVIEGIATALANVSRQAGRTVGVIPTLIQNLKNLPRNIFAGFAGAQIGRNVVIPQKKEEVKLTLTQRKQEELMAKLEKESLKREKERLALKNKQLKTDKLKQAIEKANLALNKGEEIFDMDKIQIAAALTNQAEQLGKATSTAQVLQIANDTARLNVKRSILALEDAIASKDEAAIVAATAKLNADLRVLGALTGQSAKLSDIKSILESLKPKDLINLANLDAAIAKMMELLRLQGTKTLVPTTPSAVSGTTVSGTTVSGTPSNTGNPALDSLIDLRKGTETGTAINFLLKEHIDEIIAASSSSMVDEQSQLAMMRILNRTGIGATSGFDPARFRAADNGNPININVTAGVGDPEAIARAVEDVIRQSYQRGTSSTGLLAV